MADIDPVVTDPGKYHTILENEHVRVLDYHDTPGEKTAMHYHREFVLYALSAFDRKLTYPDGKTTSRSFVPGDVIWMDAQSHIGENIGKTNTHVVIVEIKRSTGKKKK